MEEKPNWLSGFPVQIYCNRRVFWAKGYYVNTVGGNEAKIRKYIQEQEMQDQMSDQLSFREYEDPFKNIADLDDDSPEIPTDSRRKK